MMMYIIENLSQYVYPNMNALGVPTSAGCFDMEAAESSNRASVDRDIFFWRKVSKEAIFIHINITYTKNQYL